MDNDGYKLSPVLPAYIVVRDRMHCQYFGVRRFKAITQQLSNPLWRESGQHIVIVAYFCISVLGSRLSRRIFIVT